MLPLRRRLGVAALALACLAVPATAAAAPATHIASGDPLLPDEWWIAAVGADKAEPPGPGKPVTVIDTGVDLTHPEFATRPNTIALNPQAVGSAPSEAHGTQVASVLAAPADGAGLVGVYPQAVLRVWDMGTGTAGLIAGLDAAARAGAGVINVSLGTSPSRALEDAVYAAVRRGSLVVASVGNEREQGSPSQQPAGIPHVLTVGAVDEKGEVAPFSSSSPYLDLVAPGTNIRVAVPKAFDQVGFRFATGTSFSTPIVAGAAAWLWTQRPDLDAGQVAELLRRTARDVGAPGWDADSGYGALDIPAALAAEAPPPNPGEPNDDVELGKGRPLLKAGGPRRAELAARLETFEDPRDVYPVWVPAGGTLTVTVSGDPDVDLELWRPATFSVKEQGVARRADLAARSARQGTQTDAALTANRTKRGRYFYAAVLPGIRTREASYTVTAVATVPR